jgi:hypothetical protein
MIRQLTEMVRKIVVSAIFAKRDPPEPITVLQLRLSGAQQIQLTALSRVSSPDCPGISLQAPLIRHTTMLSTTANPADGLDSTALHSWRRS